jgi:hypothetical protein
MQPPALAKTESGPKRLKGLQSSELRGPVLVSEGENLCDLFLSAYS